MEYHLNAGSNIGDRRANLARAVELLCGICGAREVAVSEVVESEPWGYDSVNTFANVGINLTTALTPRELLDACQAVERQMGSLCHRDAHGNYADRVIDIDIIAAGDWILNTPRLAIPHPRMHLRRFVLEPMAQLMPSWRHPVSALTPQMMLNRQAL